MASINYPFDTADPTVNDDSGLDYQRFQDLKKAIQERAWNLGLYYPTESTPGPYDALSGLLFLSPSAYDASHFRIYDDDGTGKPDPTDVLLDLDGTTGPPYTLTIGNTTSNVNLTLKGDATINALTATDGTFSGTLKAKLYRAVSFLDPTSGDSITLIHVPASHTIYRVDSVIRGSSSPSVTWNLYFASDRSSTTPTQVWTTDKTTTNTTTGDSFTTFDNDTLSSGDFLWLKINSTAGTVNEFSATVHMREV